jgi:uncharacterized SAM-binding protein YcdF (DUF218 family)
MVLDLGQSSIDWDGIWTFLLTLLLLPVGFGIPLLICVVHVYRTARTQTSQCYTTHVLVFGKRLVNQQIDDDYKQRLDKAFEYLQTNPEARLLLVGGVASGQTVSEAQAGKNYLLNLGIKAYRLKLEQESQNTLENLQHARRLLEQDNAFPITLISNRYHLARINTISTSLSMSHQLCACEEKFHFKVHLLPRLIMEGWYILWFHTGKSWSRLIRSQRMLSRVT